MNKKKILVLAMTLSMVAILAIGGTIAYFTDTDFQVNTFTTGNVQIDLFEDFSETGIAHLVPTTGEKDDKGRMINGIEKEVYVENEGSEDAFVRIHFAIPDAIDSGAKDIPALNASDNIVHWNHAKESTVPTKWSWKKTAAEDGTNGYPGNNGPWNYYETVIDGIDYNVYVATYRTALTTGDVTIDAVNQVYMDVDTTNEMITDLINGKKDEKGNVLVPALGEKWYIYVAAEGTQAQGYEGDAYKALNAAFGDPTAAGYVSKVDWDAVAEGETYREWTSVKGW